MAGERLHASHDVQSLAPLTRHSELLDYQRGRIVVLDKLPTPVDEHNIPQPKQLIRDVLGSLAVTRHWTGYSDVHHVAWPGARYRDINQQDSSLLGSYYRGTAALKVRLPRQLHNYIHATTEPPESPDIETMWQWVKEQHQVCRLYDTISTKSLSTVDLTEAKREKYRFNNYQQKLETMEDGELGLMPNRELLAQLEITEARQVLRTIAKVKGFSNRLSRQRQFFANELLPLM